ncbi:UTRA domain-containing protein [Streptomyces sp. ISL-44]|uniref:GntR family transcriptional regulator n=1 Tax=Streptomyces sp. ISL-44 TaxID=2819184 RepID=UPI001BE52846|nr:UTRA domain-containing protein [Streptomyces sp. ISL-44]MBT2543729.1 UTRA domain-containing protein [Streptomyces sp. ISL-44]
MGSSGWTSTSMPYLAPRAAGASDAWTDEAKAKGHRGGQRIVEARQAPASLEVASLLGLPEGEPVVVRRRLIELDGEPCELTDTYYPAGIAAGTPLAGTAKIPGGAVTLLAALGHAGVRVTEDVTARMPSAGEREQLGLGEAEPVLRLSRVTYDATDRAIQADVMVMPATRQQLRYEIRIG